MPPSPRQRIFNSPPTSDSDLDPDLTNRKEILYNGYLYDVTDFMSRHPGGSIINYYVQDGEDATLPMQQFHFRSDIKVSSVLKSLKHRPAPESERSTDQSTQQRHEALTADYLTLFNELKNEGYFHPSTSHIAFRFLQLAAMFCIGMTLGTSSSFPIKLLGLIIMGIYGGQCGWVVHEAGHNSFTGRPRLDKFLSALISTTCSGVSGTWWMRQHNRHHAMPQRLHRDVDLDTLPLLAFNAKVAQNQGGKSRPNFFLRYQAYLFLTLDSFLVGLFWAFYIKYKYMLSRKLIVEIIGTAINFCVAYTLGLYPTFFCIWVTTVYMFGNFSLSHTHLPVSTTPKHWVEYALMHTTDIEPSPLVNWWMGYLNCQIEHHLFPTMPQYRQPEIRERVRALAVRHGLPYHSCSYWEAVKKAFVNLLHVSEALE